MMSIYPRSLFPGRVRSLSAALRHDVLHEWHRACSRMTKTERELNRAAMQYGAVVLLLLIFVCLAVLALFAV